MELLKALTSITAPSGSEEAIRRFISENILNYCDNLTTDTLGNLIALKRGTSSTPKNIMFAAHMDEVGIIITYIDDNNFARFSNLGRISLQGLLNAKVVFTSGTIGIVRSEAKSSEKLTADKMFIDPIVGKINVGDCAVFSSRFDEGGDFVSSKSLDDRVGCYILIRLLREIKSANDNLYFVFTCQEEVGLRGARTSAYGITPDLAIAIDVTPAYDYPCDQKSSIKLGAGPAVKIKDNSVLCHPTVKELLISSADKLGINYQLEVLTRGGTDAGAIHQIKSGVPSGVLSIPTRYIHTMAEVASKQDIENAVNILKTAIKSL